MFYDTNGVKTKNWKFYTMRVIVNYSYPLAYCPICTQIKIKLNKNKIEWTMCSQFIHDWTLL